MQPPLQAVGAICGKSDNSRISNIAGISRTAGISSIARIACITPIARVAGVAGKYRVSGFKITSQIIGYPGPNRAKWGILFLLMFAVHACSPVQRLTADTEGYNVSETDAAAIISRTPNHDKTITSLDGRARTQVSRPGVSERATVSFVADRQQTLITIRNNLGIEGGRIYADRDSVTVYDRIEKTAWRTGIDQTPDHFLIGFTAFNLIDFIDPILDADQVEMVLEDDRHYKLLFFDGKTVIFNRQNYLIERIVFKTPDPESFSTFVFENYAGLSGFELPRTIRIFSQDGRSVIHLVTQALELNRNNLDFDIGIPSDLTISRI